LNISGSCGVSQDGISNLKSVKQLYAGDNGKIKNVNHLEKLEELNVSGSCGVNQEGISNLKSIKDLKAQDNNKISVTNYFKNKKRKFS